MKNYIKVLFIGGVLIMPDYVQAASISDAARARQEQVAEYERLQREAQGDAATQALIKQMQEQEEADKKARDERAADDAAEAEKLAVEEAKRVAEERARRLGPVRAAPDMTGAASGGSGGGSRKQMPEEEEEEEESMEKTGPEADVGSAAAGGSGAGSSKSMAQGGSSKKPGAGAGGSGSSKSMAQGGSFKKSGAGAGGRSGGTLPQTDRDGVQFTNRELQTLKNKPYLYDIAVHGVSHNGQEVLRPKESRGILVGLHIQGVSLNNALAEYMASKEFADLVSTYRSSDGSLAIHSIVISLIAKL